MTKQGWFILLLMLLCSFAGEAQTTQNKPKNYCSAVKSDGNPCKIVVKTAGSKCYHHSDTTIRCGFIKKDGNPCRIPVKTGQCRYHKPKQ